MRALLFDEFGQLPQVAVVDDPCCPPAGVVIGVEATGLCRSDWHGWMGHDAGIRLPHVPGHELAGRVVEVGPDVTSWHVGDRVTTPFVCACGSCATCARGDQQVCEHQFQPGFTHWGSFAELVAIDRAEVNLVRVPEEMELDTAASLGCRFSTAYRAVVRLGAVTEGSWVAVHGCGGVGLSAVMIAESRGARVVAVDVALPAMDLATSVGAEVVLDASREDVAQQIVELTGGGAALSIDALGSATIVESSLRCLRRRGRHVQIGLLADPVVPVPMDLVVSAELELLGSHGMAAHEYPPMMAEIAAGRLHPDRLIRDRSSLEEAAARLVSMNEVGQVAAGITIIRP